MADEQPAPFRVGVLPPESNFVPLLASDLLAALEFGLAESGLRAEVVLEFAGYNADPLAVLPHIQSLLLRQRVACVIAPFNVSLANTLGSHFQNHRIPLIALNLGEDPWFESARHPFVFVHNYGLWHAAWMGGYIGAQRFGPRAAVLTAMHDSGYGLTFAFQLGVEAAGGSLTQINVTHRNSSTEDPSEAIASMAEHSPDFIWAAYSGKEAVSFHRAYSTLSRTSTIPVVGLPPLVDSHVREAAGDAIAATYVVTPEPPLTDAQALALPLAQTLGRVPNPYAMLGYEAAHLVAAAVRARGEGSNNVADLASKLRMAEFHGPRGAVRFQEEAEQEMAFSLCHTTSAHRSFERIDVPPLLYEQSALARKKLSKQGWTNPYLCG